MANPSEVHDDIMEAFRIGGWGEDSLVEARLMANVLQTIDANTWTDEQVERLFEAADLNRDGFLDLAEFTTWLASAGSAPTAARVADPPASDFRPKNIRGLRVEPAAAEDAALTARLVADAAFSAGDGELLSGVQTYAASAQLGARSWRVNVAAVPCRAENASGRVALFMHGHGHSCCISTWGRFWAPLLRQGFHLLAFDAPGFGRSEGADGQTIAWRDFGGDLVLSLLSAFGVRPEGKVTVFGQCMGGAMFLRALLQSPDTFAARHVLHNCTIGSWPQQFPEILKQKGGGVQSFWWLDPDHMRESNVYNNFTAMMSSSPELCTFVDLQRDRTLPEFFSFAQVNEPGLTRTDNAVVLGFCSDAVRDLVAYVLLPPRRRTVGPSAPKKTMLQLGMDNPDFKVFVRTRPLLPREAGMPSCCDIHDVEDPGGRQVQQVIVRRPDADTTRSATGEFVFERVFLEEATQTEVWTALRESLDVVGALLGGVGATVMVYGQTGSGKTHTIDGSGTGIKVRLVQDLYQRASMTKDIHCSYVQLYNEDFLDLFDPPSKLSQDGSGNVVGARVLQASTAEGLLAKIDQGSEFRASGKTNMNDASSRSHSILSLSISDKGDALDTAAARLFVVDLAGSERVKRSGVSGVRLAEAVAINQSLLALANVTQALVENNGRERAYVPYRDSALTQLLRNSLGGSARTALIACVSVAADSFNETLGTLRFAACATHVQNRSDEARHNAVAAQQEEDLEAALVGRSVEFTDGQATISTEAGMIHCYGDLSGPADAPTVVMLHYYGKDVDATMWEYMFEPLRASGCRYIAPDMPGHGASLGQSSSKPEDYCSHAGPVDVIRQLLDACGVKKAALVGYDWGGGIACAFAHKHPNRTRSLVAWCASVREPKELEKLRRRKKDVLVLWARNDQWHPYRKGTEIATAMGVGVTDIRCRHKGGWEDARTQILEFLSGSQS